MAVELRTDIFPSIAHELVSHVMAVVDKMKNLEVGDRWLNRVRSSMSPELREAVAGVGVGEHVHGPWYSLIGMTYVHRWATVDDLLKGLESIPETDLIMEIAGVDELPTGRAELGDWALRAAAGDKAAAGELAKRGQALGLHGAPKMARWLPRVGPRL